MKCYVLQSGKGWNQRNVLCAFRMGMLFPFHLCQDGRLVGIYRGAFGAQLNGLFIVTILQFYLIDPAELPVFVVIDKVGVALHLPSGVLLIEGIPYFFGAGDVLKLLKGVMECPLVVKGRKDAGIGPAEDNLINLGRLIINRRCGDIVTGYLILQI